MSVLNKINNLPISIKTKTMILVLSLFILMSCLFSILRYYDVKQSIQDSSQDFKEQISNIYNTTLQRVDKFYSNRAYANIESYGIKDALKNEDSKELIKLSLFRWNVLKQENPFLINMRFYNSNKEKLAVLGEDSLNSLINFQTSHNQAICNFVFDEEILSYNILIPAIEHKEVIGYVEFSFTVEYFLSEIKEFSKLEGFIISNNTFLTKPTSDLKDLANSNKTVYYLDNKVFIKHLIELKSKYQEKKAQLLFLQNITNQQQILVDAIYEAFFLSLGLISIISIVLHYGFEVLIKKLETSENSLRTLNQTLEERVHNEIENRYKQERILMHQSRLASMGEMIGNIAHQWRQPLADLGAILINISFLYDLKKLTSDVFNERLKKAESLISHMSSTIDDFRNFFANDTKQEEFCVTKSIEKAIELIESALKDHHIKLIFDDKKSYTVFGYPNQFSQAILNVLGNAKDILLERKIENPFIKITITSNQNDTIITISDNAGGIKVEPIEKIFEPYVSTKHAISGTGIGLYMTKTIIEKNLKGKLKALNGKEGATFIIKIANKTS